MRNGRSCLLVSVGARAPGEGGGIAWQVERDVPCHWKQRRRMELPATRDQLEGGRKEEEGRREGGRKGGREEEGERGRKGGRNGRRKEGKGCRRGEGLREAGIKGKRREEGREKGVTLNSVLVVKALTGDGGDDSSRVSSEVLWWQRRLRDKVLEEAVDQRVG